MKYQLRNTLISIFPWAFEWAESIKMVKHANRWRQGGFVVPLPNLVKRSILLREANSHLAETFVETGTFLGDTPWFLRKRIKRIVTIEVHEPLAKLARSRFRNHQNIQVIQGDSGDVLRDVVPSLEGRVLFWLDGHYSKGITGKGIEDCPIFRELTTIVEDCHADWRILIDDARDFGADPAYPSIPQLRDFFAQRNIPVDLTVANDIIRIARI